MGTLNKSVDSHIRSISDEAAAKITTSTVSGSVSIKDTRDVIIDPATSTDITDLGTTILSINYSGSTEPISVELTRPADTNSYVADDCISDSTSAPSILNFANVVASNGKGGNLERVVIVSDDTAFASKTVLLKLYKETVTAGNDNAALVEAYANASKFVCDVQVTFGAVVGSSTSVVGEAQIFKNFKCASADVDFYGQLVTLDAVTSPKSGGKFNIELFINRQ